MVRSGRGTRIAGRTLIPGVVAVACFACALARAPAMGLVRLPSGHVLQVEIAKTPAEIQRGYMFREKISDNEGMVFLLGSRDFHSFWMKNCKVPLDIVWLDDDWNVVHLEESLPPCEADPCPSWTPLRAATYVLETRGGLVTREGVRTGAHVVFVPPGAPSGSPPHDGDSRH